ncbi:hypothetical protein KEM55_007476 [Ascosphaera atra]|nr:hypothetical protein KEM55_007476 [Ascosphaera atra]
MERLTGRAEQRRPLREWIAVLLQMLLMTGLVIFTILFMSTLAMRARDATVKPPGKKYWVDNDKYQVHLQCIGKEDASTPTVLVEAGELPVEHTMQQWVDRAYVTGKIERYCIWDRPGVAWSENAPSPHSAGMSADVLGEALAIAGEDGPYVLVSAGVGGIYSRIFAGRHAGQIKGIMLVDALHEDLLSRVGSSGRGFKLWLRGIFSPLGIDRLGGAIFKGRTRADRVYGRSSYQSDKFLKASLQENLVAESMTLSDIKRANEGQNRTTPLVVVASGVETGRDKKWAQKQEELCRITDNLVFYKAIKGAPHEVWRKAEGSRILERELEKLVLGKH